MYENLIELVNKAKEEKHGQENWMTVQETMNTMLSRSF